MKKDFTEYRQVLQRGVEQRENIEKAVEKIVEKGVENVFLVGCGGSLAVMFPCKYILEVNSKLPVYAYNAGEFLNVRPKNFSNKSLVILSSYTGTTKETVAAAKIAKEIGASTIGFTGKADSPLAKTVDYAFVNDAKSGVTDSKLIMLYQIIFSLIKHTDNYERYDDIMKALELMPENLVNVKYQAEDKAIKFANENKDEKYFMTIGSGICWGEAYSYAICILEEMQWIHAQPVHAGEYFHGPFEIVTEDTNLLIFKGEDLSRKLEDRVLEFSKKYTNKITVIDTKEYDLKGIPEDLRGYMSPLVISSIMDRYSENLAEVRNHPLSTRRYMFKVEY